MHKGHILNELIPALLADAAQGLPRVRQLTLTLTLTLTTDPDPDPDH